MLNHAVQHLYAKNFNVTVDGRWRSSAGPRDAALMLMCVTANGTSNLSTPLVMKPCAIVLSSSVSMWCIIHMWWPAIQLATSSAGRIHRDVCTLCLMHHDQCLLTSSTQSCESSISLSSGKHSSICKMFRMTTHLQQYKECYHWFLLFPNTTDGYWVVFITSEVKRHWTKTWPTVLFCVLFMAHFTYAM